MNYGSQLRGWAVDRIIELAKANKQPITLNELKEQAVELMNFAYIQREDLESTAKDLFDLVRNAPFNQSSVYALIETLERIKTDREAEGLETKPENKEV